MYTIYACLDNYAGLNVQSIERMVHVVHKSVSKYVPGKSMFNS